VAADLREPGRMWNLWDMYELHGAGLVHVLAKLGRLQAASAAAVSSISGGLVTNELRIALIQHMREMLAVTKDIDAPVTRAGCEHLLASAERQHAMTVDFLWRATDEIQSRLYTEIESVIFLGIEPRMAGHYAPPEPLFGSDVALKFSSVVYEVEEAGKCLALDRATACAFHSIRCLEAGIRAMARCLAIPDPTRAVDRSWPKLLRAIKDEIDKRWPQNMPRGGGDDELFDNAYAALAAMQNPWRNSTMHLDQGYTPEDARHVFEIVGGFMRKLASRMDEDGLPLA